MAGGSENDVLFGQLGDDWLAGDGSIGDSANEAEETININDACSDQTDDTLYFNVPEATTDGDDYMEGNGGSDTMFGGLGQDDIVGGSSSPWSERWRVTSPRRTPCGQTDPTLIYGGSNNRTARNAVGDDPSLGHVRDADYIMGDNANIYRLVGINNTPGGFLVFAYDGYEAEKLVPRAMEQLDYTLGGGDYSDEGYDDSNGLHNRQAIKNGFADNGTADLILGEDGDDVIFGMTGSEVIFGNEQDDDIIGGYGNDWISGGVGQDGVIGDDGLIMTSRNGSAEPLYGLAATTQQTITTPGQIQTALINQTDQLKKKTVDLDSL